MIDFGAIDIGGGNCGCCCSYGAEGYTQAMSAGRGKESGSCAGSCIDGNTANLNANIATATGRIGPDGGCCP